MPISRPSKKAAEEAQARLVTMRMSTKQARKQVAKKEIEAARAVAKLEELQEAWMKRARGPAVDEA